MIRKNFVLVALLTLMTTGCATIFNGRTEAVQFRSTPDQADVVISNRAGEITHRVTTPATVTLNRSAGFFKPEIYTAVVTKPGFKPGIIAVPGKVNNWYFANLVIGGVIGMLIVDPATGAMFSFSPSTTEAKLTALSTSNPVETNIQDEPLIAP
ncbi:hypothetical protein [Stenotrophobium rhamnosiphilum]|uniref:PEGA domain-containing protein n=1 Tax=Stenotrophobium rhamnosiphilum TaxID=2029166 RepID=A0A2T5MHS5_9GAMM|nr:hypothetical protein [Stenotrophobium rhamnosiphilum]PTU32135.1 hypothetical protein CJD38_05560 [Stenotrophobium rhamnosiphilum]